jgi:hypothetical protein
MANVTVLETLDRRAQVKAMWVDGKRSAYKIAKLLNVGPKTVAKDLLVIRRMSLQRYKTDDFFTLVKLEEDAGLLRVVEQCNELIEKLLKEPEIKTEVRAENNTPLKKSQETYGINYSAISTFMEKLLKARKQRAELWGFVKTGGPNIGIKVEQSTGEKSNGFDGVSEPDLRKVVELARLVEGLDNKVGTGSAESSRA